MKLLFLNSLLLIFLCCANNSTKTDYKNNQNVLTCDSVYYSTRMREIASIFQPYNLNLNMTIPLEMKEFISNSKKTCIVNNREYVFFVSVVLLKLAIYHAQEAKIGFDLNGMKDSTSNLFIEGLRAKVNKPSLTKEFFSSYEVVEFIKSNEELSKDPYVSDLLIKFDMLIDGIVNKK